MERVEFEARTAKYRGLVMRILKICLVILVMFPMSSQAQFRSFSCELEKAISSKEAEGLLDQVQARYSKIKTVKALFEQQSYLAALDMQELSSGRVWFKKPGAMKWDYQEPDEQVFIIDNNEFWFYQKEDNQVTIDNFDQVVISDLPVSFLMGIGNLKDKFNFVSGCRKLEGLVFELAPRPKKGAADSEESASLEKFRLLVDTSSYAPLGAEIVDAGGNITSILLRDRSWNDQVDSSVFKRNAPAGVDLIDRRQEQR